VIDYSINDQSQYFVSASNTNNSLTHGYSFVTPLVPYKEILFFAR